MNNEEYKKMKKNIMLITITILLYTNCITQPISINIDSEASPETAVAEVQEETPKTVKPELSANIDSRIVGTWIFDNPEMEGFGFEFFEDAIVHMNMQDEIVSGTYSMRFVSDPVVLRINVPDMGDIITLIDFISDDVMKMQNNVVGEHQPVGFTDDSALLIRVFEF